MAAWLDQYSPNTRYREGDIVEGEIVRAGSKSILIDIGGKQDALVPPQEVERIPPKRLSALQPGISVAVYILDPGGEETPLLVSLNRAAAQQDWTRARQMMKDDEVVDLEVIDCNKGGVLVHLGHLRGFVPGSQLLPTWHPHQNPDVPERRWEALLGETLRLKVIEVTPADNRLILSERKACDEKARKREILQKLEVGATYPGVVSNIVDFGAFVNVNGVDGLLHISELSWERVSHPSEVVNVGDEIKVYVLGIDLDRLRLNLSLKKLQPDPWQTITERYHEGQLIEVEIVNLVPFGAFACPIDMKEIEGLIHISELCPRHVDQPEEVVEVGMRTTVRILSLQPEARRAAFSLKRVPDNLRAA